MNIVVSTVEVGDKTVDGYVIQYVSWEGEYSDDRNHEYFHHVVNPNFYWVVTKVWTHESFQKPRSVVWRHRQWDPIDTIALQSRNEGVVVRSDSVKHSSGNMQLFGRKPR